MLVKEYIDWTGKWVSEKPNKFEKSSEYFYKQELLKKILGLIEKYKNKIDKKDLSEIVIDLKEKYNI